MAAERTMYRDRSPWPVWLGVLLGSITAVLSYAVLAGWDLPPMPLIQRVWRAALVAAGFGAIKLLFGGLTVLVRETGLLLHLGALPIVRRTVPYAEIEALRAVRYHPIREFGGWGIRGMGKRKAWTARGDRAVELKLTDGRELLIGSDYPQRLEERIRAASGKELADG